MKPFNCLLEQTNDLASFENRYRRFSIATLADPSERGITCSDHIVVTALNPAKVVACETFEEAAAAVLHNTADYLVVPAAYRGVATFLHSADLALADIFVSLLPPLVVAGIHVRCPDHVTTFFYQPATESMLGEVGIACMDETEPVSSNAVAAHAVKGAAGISACITNQLSAERIGLVVYKVLRTAEPMPFFIFAKRDITITSYKTTELQPGEIVAAVRCPTSGQKLDDSRACLFHRKKRRSLLS